MASCTIETRFASARSICKAARIAVLTVAALATVFTKVTLGALLLTPVTLISRFAVTHACPGIT